jgi:hypothetical protein
VLKGNFSDASSLLQAGYRFEYPELIGALENLTDPT